MLSPTLGLTSSVSRPEWASQWHRPQVNNEYQQVSDDYKLHMQTFGNTVRAVRLRSSKQDSRPCDALRRYVQRAEERAAALPTMPRRTRWGPPNTARRTRWGPCAAHCVDGGKA